MSKIVKIERPGQITGLLVLEGSLALLAHEVEESLAYFLDSFTRIHGVNHRVTLEKKEPL